MTPRKPPKISRPLPPPPTRPALPPLQPALNLSPSLLVRTLHQLGLQWVNPQAARQLPTSLLQLTLYPLPPQFLTLFSPF